MVRGVDVRVSTTLERADTDAVTLSDGDTIETRTLVWTAGVRANPLLAEFGLRASEGQVSDIPMRRSDIADFLSLSRETVCRALTQLSCEGVAEVKAHGSNDS